MLSRCRERWTPAREIPSSASSERIVPVYWRPSPSAQGYVGLLSAASSAIKRVDRGAEIVTAGCRRARVGFRCRGCVAAAYRAGGKRAFDTVAVHPYGASSGEVLERVRTTRATMSRFGDRKASVWVTGLGWADAPPYAGCEDFWGLHTGLLDIDGRDKPAYEAFRSSVSGFR